MDPNSSLMHEALRGTTAVPIVNTFAQSNVRAPQNPSMMPAYDHSFPHQYNKDIPPTLPTPPNFPSVLTPPPANPFESVTFMEGFINQQPMLSSQHRFMTSPASEYSNQSAHHFQTLSVKPPCITPFLHGAPAAAVNSHLSINVGSDPGPIFEGTPWPIPEIGSGPRNTCFPLESQHYSFNKYMQQENQLLQASYYRDPYGPSFGQFPVYHYAQWQQQMPTSAPSVTSDGMVPDAMGFASPSKRVKREYKCMVCNARFPTPQAFGGHMSSHSKAAKKNNLIMNDPSATSSQPGQPSRKSE